MAIFSVHKGSEHIPFPACHRAHDHIRSIHSKEVEDRDRFLLGLAVHPSNDLQGVLVAPRLLLIEGLSPGMHKQFNSGLTSRVKKSACARFIPVTPTLEKINSLGPPVFFFLNLRRILALSLNETFPSMNRHSTPYKCNTCEPASVLFPAMGEGGSSLPV